MKPSLDGRNLLVKEEGFRVGKRPKEAFSLRAFSKKGVAKNSDLSQKQEYRRSRSPSASSAPAPLAGVSQERQCPKKHQAKLQESNAKTIATKHSYPPGCLGCGKPLSREPIQEWNGSQSQGYPIKPLLVCHVPREIVQ